MKTFEEVYFVINSFRLLEEDDMKILSYGDNELYINHNCNDFFWWGCADLEEINPEDIPDIQKAHADCVAASPLKSYLYLDVYIDLWVCRKRKLRPQGAVYKGINPIFHGLFNDAGPEREIDLGNPYDQDYKYEYQNKFREIGL